MYQTISTFDISSDLVIVVTVFNLDIPADGSIGPGTTSSVFRKPIFTIPVEIFASHFHPFDHLTEMSVGLQHDEGGVSGEDNSISGVSVHSAAVLDVSVLVVYTVWKLTSVLVAVSYILIIPPDVSCLETCVMQTNKQSSLSLY